MYTRVKKKEKRKKKNCVAKKKKFEKVFSFMFLVLGFRLFVCLMFFLPPTTTPQVQKTPKKPSEAGNRQM